MSEPPREVGAGEPVERVVLVGFMASGKSTVGRLLADRIGWKHFDLDGMIEAERGRSVAEIFARDGEASFRAAEAEVTRRLASQRQAVLTPGGGWITNPALPELLRSGTLTVWLKVSPDEVVRRVQVDGSPADRPLLGGAPDPSRIQALLLRREPLYARADLTIETTGRTADDVAAELATLLSSR